jgi:hypothetical protein
MKLKILKRAETEAKKALGELKHLFYNVLKNVGFTPTSTSMSWLKYDAEMESDFSRKISVDQIYAFQNVYR